MTKKRNRESTINKILDSAIHIFETYGFIDGLTEDIAHHASVAHGTIFFYFPKKSDLIIESIYRKMGVLAERLNEKSRESMEVKELCTIFFSEISKYPDFFSRLVKDLPHLPLDVQRSVFSSLSGFSIHFVDVIEKGQATGQLKAFDPSIAVQTWFGLAHYLYSYRELLGTDTFTPEQIEKISTFYANSLTA